MADAPDPAGGRATSPTCPYCDAPLGDYTSAACPECTTALRERGHTYTEGELRAEWHGLRPAQRERMRWIAKHKPAWKSASRQHALLANKGFVKREAAPTRAHGDIVVLTPLGRDVLAVADSVTPPRRDELLARLAQVEADERLHYPQAHFLVNGFLAVEQTVLHTRANTLRWVLGLPQRAYFGKDAS